MRLLILVAAIIHAAATAAAQDVVVPPSGIDAKIRALSLTRRVRLIENYAASSQVFRRFIKHRGPAAVHVSCPDEGCSGPSMQMLENLRAAAPQTLGERVAEADAAQIEIYVTPQPAIYEMRDRALDAKLDLSTKVTGRSIGYPPKTAPCWTRIYYDGKTGIIEKALIFINSEASDRMQFLCMGFELVRAAGVANLPGVYFYSDMEKRRKADPAPSLTANAYLHGLQEIAPGDSVEKALAVFVERYELKKKSP